jgi:hypothetical protein
MQYIILGSKKEQILIDKDDYELVKNYSWNCYGGYARTFFKKNGGKLKSISMHRLILNKPNNTNIDHINGNGLDNRRSNLRLASVQQNGCNRKVGSNNTSSYKGVIFHKRDKKYQSSIKYKGKRSYLGYYNNAEDAAKAYDEAAKKLFGEFARLNCPTK